MFKSYIHTEFREAYRKKPGDKLGACIFCREDRGGFLIHSTESSFVIANEFPYNYGHLMVMPKRHVKDIRDLTKEELKDFFSLMKKFLDLTEKVYDVHSFNVGFNMGPSSGATVEHLHIHIVPRWAGDSGFSETTSSTRAIKEAPQKTVERLKKASEGKIDFAP